MKRNHLVALLVSLSVILIGGLILAGCGTNPSGGGGSTTPFVADIYVSSVNGSDETGDGSLNKPFKTIQKGLDSATSTKEVVGVEAGTYKERLSWPSTTYITLKGVSNSSAILDAENTGRAITLPSKISQQLITIESLTIMNGSTTEYGAGIILSEDYIVLNLKDLVIKNNASTGGGTQGGGIYSSLPNSLLILQNCTFTGNRAEYGGAIFSSSPFIMINCLVKNNSAEGGSANGGGIYFSSPANPYFYGTTIEGNTSSSNAGGILGDTCPATFEYCTIINNSAAGYGAGARFDGAGVVVKFEACLIKGNSSTAGHGGGIYSSAGSSIDIERCVIMNNAAASNSSGGGVCFNSLASAEIVNCIFSGNSAYDGGGIYFDSGGTNEVNIVNSTFVTNEAFHNGSSLYCVNGNEAEILNCIFYGNKDGSIKDLYVATSGTADMSYSRYTAGSTGGTGTITGTANTTEAPSFAVYPTNVALLGPTAITRGGTTEGDVPDKDIYGITRHKPDYVSMGAIEFQD